MQPKELIGKYIGARAFKVLSFYDSALPPFTLKFKHTTSGRIISKVVDVVARPSTSGNELMIGLADENGTSWVLYQPDLFFYGGTTEGDPKSKFISLDESAINSMADENSFINSITQPIKKYFLLGAVIVAAIALIKKR